MTREELLDLLNQEIENQERTLPIELPRWVQ